MARPFSLLSLLLLVGATSAAVVYSRNVDGSFSASADESPKNPFVVAPGEDGPTNIVNSPLDDEDLELVQQYFLDEKINQTGKLRYSSLATVQRSLVKDIVRTILKNEEYKLLLNNPSFPDVVRMVKSMIREPIQEVLQQQIWNKVLAVQAYYMKVYKPLSNPETKRESLEFLKHLKSASESKKLTVEDTVKLKNKMQNLAFLIQEKVFKEKLDDLKKTFKNNQVSKNSKDYELESVDQLKKLARKFAVTATTDSPVTGNATSVPVENSTSISVSTETPATLSTSPTTDGPTTSDFVDPGADY